MATWVMSIAHSTGYFGILLLMFVENVFPPIPSEFIMPLAGYMAAQGKLSLFGIILAGMAGSVFGALPLYYLGGRLGGLPERVCRQPRPLANIIEKGHRKGQAMVRQARWRSDIFFRLISGVRSLISIPAGIARMRILPFLAYTAAGTAIWAAVLAYLGYFLGTQFTQVGEYLDPISWIVLGAIGVLYFTRVIQHKGQKSEKRTAT
jgi:membrane protein DedA with SNARE-associated domain